MRVSGNEPDWWSILREVDEPVERVEPIQWEISQILGPNPDPDLIHRLIDRADKALSGRETPRDFDRVAEQARLDRLAERLSEAYGRPLTASQGPAQDSALFGDVRIPGDATRTRTKGTRFPLDIEVLVSNFGGFATYQAVHGVGHPSPTRKTPVHPTDRERIEPALTGLGYRVVPLDVLHTPYDGPNASADTDVTWYIRYFDFV